MEIGGILGTIILCGTVMSENKIEDKKVFVENRTPHIMAGIEVNLTRNEQNINFDSTNQVLEKYQIENYSITLLDS